MFFCYAWHLCGHQKDLICSFFNTKSLAHACRERNSGSARGVLEETQRLTEEFLLIDGIQEMEEIE